MWISLIAVLLAIFDVTLAPTLTLWNGAGYFLPSLMLLSSAHGQWRQWFFWLIALIITGFFHQYSPLYFLLLILLSIAGYLILIHSFNIDETWLSMLLVTLMTILFIVIHTYAATKTFDLGIVGSILLTLPVIVLWYRAQSRYAKGMR